MINVLDLKNQLLFLRLLLAKNLVGIMNFL